MIQATVFAYFVVVAIGVVLLVFPDRRARAVSTLSQAFVALVVPLFRSVLALTGSLGRAHGGGARSFDAVVRWVAQHRLLSFIALAALLAPSLIVLGARGPAVFDFAEQIGASDRQITLLLEGEQLVPPLPLPPEVFTTREVEMIRPDIVYASRNWSLLDQAFTQHLLVVFKLMKERHGYEMVLIEGYRSPERQTRLLAEGSHVTQAAANMSYHQYGLAADSAFLRNGKIAISERDPWVMRGYELYGEVAEQVGLTWGGRWKMQDYGHVELRRPGVLGSHGSRDSANGQP